MWVVLPPGQDCAVRGTAHPLNFAGVTKMDFSTAC
jgi:hypothetical protein